MKNKLVVAVFVVAFFLRFIGVYPGFNNYHSDEPILYGDAVDMIRNGNLDPGRFDYPGVSVYINYISYRLIFIPLGWASYYFRNLGNILDGTVHIPIAPLAATSIQQTYIFGNREINVLTWGRTVAALFSFGNVVLAYLLAKKLYGKDVAIITAIFVAFNFRQVLNAHVNLPDIYNAFFLLLSLIVSYKVWEAPNKKNYIMAGLCAGLSFATKYQFFALIGFGIAHLFSGQKLFSKKVFIGASAFCLAFLLTNPYFLPHLELALRWVSGVAMKYGMGAKKFNLYPFFYYYHFDLGPVESVLVILGIALAAIKNFKKTFFVVATLLPFFYILNYYSLGGFYIRNYVTVTPIVLIFAAFGFWQIYLLVKNNLNKRLAKLVLLMGLIAALLVPATNTVINDYFDTKKYDYNLLSEWMFAHIPAGVVIAANPFDPPTGTPEIKKTEFELGGSYNLAEHKEDGAEYALLNTDWAGNNFYIWMNFGFRDLKLFWNKPYEIMRNTFFGVASEELFRWQIYSATKPWQAPDANLILAKIPVWPQTKMHLLQKNDFSGGTDWRVLGDFEKVKIFGFYDAQIGNKKDGSLRLLPTNTRFATVRLASPPIKVKGGSLYTVAGFMKNDKALLPNKRSGFLRVDFYSSLVTSDALGEITSTSSRVYGTSDWVEKDITERAPNDAEYMVVSVQSTDTIDSTLWFDDLTISESNSRVSDIGSSYPYVKKQIDLNLLYPNSHGNL